MWSAGADTVYGGAGFDTLDLSALADNLVYIGTATFSGVAGQVRYSFSDGNLRGDLDGDGVVDFALILEGVPNIGATDLIL